MTTLDMLAGIAWDPTIRGALTVVIGVAVLMGSVYLILATNTGNRMGFLLAASGFFGWMMLMGIFWWIYGIGMVGESPSWQVVEVNTGDLSAAATEEARTINLDELPPPEELNALDAADFRAEAAREEDKLDGWRLLPLSDTQIGEAQATVDEYFAEGNYEGISGPGDYLTLYAFDTGGKDRLGADRSVVERVKLKVEHLLQVTHPTHLAILQVQPVVEQVPGPGEAPPTPEADDARPVISVVMVRSLGDLRFPSAMIALSSGLIFAVLCWMLHTRDRRLAEHLAAADA
jgi:hypothetical protein